MKPNRYNDLYPDESLRIVTTGDKQDGMTGVNWSRRFDNSVPVPDGSTIRTLGEAAEYAIRRPKKARNTEPWQRAAKGLQLAAQYGGPFIFRAQIYFCRAVHGAISRDRFLPGTTSEY